MYLVIYEMDNRLWKEECAGLAQAESFAADLTEDGTPVTLAEVIREMPAEAEKHRFHPGSMRGDMYGNALRCLPV